MCGQGMEDLSTLPSRAWLATESPANSCSEIFSVTGGVAFSNFQIVQRVLFCWISFVIHHPDSWDTRQGRKKNTVLAIF